MQQMLADACDLPVPAPGNAARGEPCQARIDRRIGFPVQNRHRQIQPGQKAAPVGIARRSVGQERRRTSAGDVPDPGPQDPVDLLVAQCGAVGGAVFGQGGEIAVRPAVAQIVDRGERDELVRGGHDIPQRLKGCTQIDLFLENSTRTNVSFELAGKKLGADVLVLPVAASSVHKGEELRDEDQQYYGSRVRDQHDLWHVLTGYGRDPLGELCLLAFSYAQTGTLGIGFIVAMATFSMSREISSQYPIRQAVWEGYRLGKRAKWLPGTEWEDMLSMPLDQLRTKLRVGKPVIYRETLNQFASDHPAQEPFAQAA